MIPSGDKQTTKTLTHGKFVREEGGGTDGSGGGGDEGGGMARG